MFNNLLIFKNKGKEKSKIKKEKGVGEGLKKTPLKNEGSFLFVCIRNDISGATYHLERCNLDGKRRYIQALSQRF